MKIYIDDSRVHDGHRGRMRSKLLTHGQRIFDTYELLEMLLYSVIPYRDTNPIAKNLLYAFGSLDGVFSASREELMGVSGIGERAADFLLTVGRLSDVIGAELVEEGISFSDYEAVGRYFVSCLAGVEEKQVLALYLDSSMRFIDMQKVYDLEYDSGGVKPKPFVDGAIVNHAAVVITAHNHPYGPFFPTPGDRATNTAVSEALNAAGIVHAEHYIVSGNSFAGIGSLKSFTVKLSQMPRVNDFLDTRTRYEEGLSNEGRAAEPVQTHSYAGYNTRDLDYFKALLSLAGRADAHSLAERLLIKYRTIENTLGASVSELIAASDEMTAAYIKLLAYLTSRRRTDAFALGVKHSPAAIAEYLKALFIGESVEKTYLIGFDRQERVIGCELLGEGTVNASEIMPRKALEAANRMSCAAVSIAHNHPFGTTAPSSDDLTLTQNFATLLGACEIDFVDHFIIAGQLCDIVFY